MLLLLYWCLFPFTDFSVVFTLRNLITTHFQYCHRIAATATVTVSPLIIISFEVFLVVLLHASTLQYWGIYMHKLKAIVMLIHSLSLSLSVFCRLPSAMATCNINLYTFIPWRLYRMYSRFDKHTNARPGIKQKWCATFATFKVIIFRCLFTALLFRCLFIAIYLFVSKVKRARTHPLGFIRFDSTKNARESFVLCGNIEWEAEDPEMV